MKILEAKNDDNLEDDNMAAEIQSINFGGARSIAGTDSYQFFIKVFFSLLFKFYYDLIIKCSLIFLGTMV